jgi:hypothetical protein
VIEPVRGHFAALSAAIMTTMVRQYRYVMAKTSGTQGVKPGIAAGGRHQELQEEAGYAAGELQLSALLYQQVDVYEIAHLSGGRVGESPGCPR